MTIYKDLEDRFIKEFRSSKKESLEDIALDEEEKNKIIFNISGSETAMLRELRVDYSEFSNHVFFGSAYSNVNFALNRIIDYPYVGELKEVNKWRDLNTGYESWFFDNFPKDHGHIALTSGSNPPSLYAQDYEGRINWGSGSFTIESLVDLDMSTGGRRTLFSLESEQDANRQMSLFFDVDGSETFVHLQFLSGADETHSASFASYAGVPRHVAVSFQNPEYVFYVDGVNIGSGAFSSGVATGSWEDFGNKKARVGYGNGGSFSGSIDEFRFWGRERPAQLISKNYRKTIHANHSSSLQLYYKFNENWLTGASKVVDHSGNDLEGVFSGSFTTDNYISGNFHPELVDTGDLILDFNNPDVDSFLITQRNSGSAYDQENSNYILELYPYFMSEDDNTEDTIKFLLLIARHWDRLKLYIQHLSNVYKTEVASFDDTPGSLLNMVGEHYGIDIGGIYESSDALQYFYGEDVSSGSFDSTIEDVRDQIKRNVLNNLMHLYKTKSTKEALQAALRALGVDDSIISVNEYTIFSGGIQTSREEKNVEKRVFRSTGDNSNYIQLPAASYFEGGTRSTQTFEVRVCLDSGSYSLSSSFTTASVLEIANVCSVDIYRENPSSSYGRLALNHSESVDSMPIKTDLLKIFDGWVNIKYDTGPKVDADSFSIAFGRLDDCNEVEHFSASGVYDFVSSVTQSVVKVGTRNGNPLYGEIQEIRVWDYSVDSDTFEHHIKDFESLTLDNFEDRINTEPLYVHIRLDDATGSLSSTASLHDYACDRTGTLAYGVSSTGSFNFPGVFIKKLQPSTGYDLNVDNDKVRIREGSDFDKNDINKDLQFLSVDFSPVAELNKEIIKWMGDIEQFSNIVGFPYLKYRSEISQINSLRTKFFNSRVNGGIDFRAYLDIVEWFDSNFTQLLKQLTPLEMGESLSNFVVEPHILEYNKVRTIFPYADESSSRALSSSISVARAITADAIDFIEPADPGRFGAFASASGQVYDAEIDYSSSYAAVTAASAMRSGSLALNHKRPQIRKFLKDYLTQSIDPEELTEIYATGYQFNQISSSNHQKEVLNIATFDLTSTYLSTSQETVSETLLSLLAESDASGAIYNYVDQRWLSYKQLGNDGGTDNDGPSWDFGISYGGGAGQLWHFLNKSIYGYPYLLQNSDTVNHIGDTVRWDRAEPEFWVRTTGRDEEMRKVVSLWPTSDSHNGVRIVVNENGEPLLDGEDAAGLGDPVDIEGYSRLYLEIVGNTGDMDVKVLSCSVRFQFFDDQYVDEGYEKILSSSLSSSVVSTKNLYTEYELSVDFGNQVFPNYEPRGFKVDLERALPSAKYMRVYINPDPNGTIVREALAGGFYNITVRGVLDTKPVSEDIVKFREG